MINLHGGPAKVYRRQSTGNTDGTALDTWPEDTTLDPFNAWPQPALSTVVERYGKRDLIVTHSCFMDINLGLKQGDVLEVSLIRYAVRGVEDQAGLGRLFAIRLEEQK